MLKFFTRCINSLWQNLRKILRNSKHFLQVDHTTQFFSVWYSTTFFTMHSHGIKLKSRPFFLMISKHTNLQLIFYWNFHFVTFYCPYHNIIFCEIAKIVKSWAMYTKGLDPFILLSNDETQPEFTWVGIPIVQRSPTSFDLRAILQKRDNLRSDPKKIMYKTTGSQDLKLKKEDEWVHHGNYHTIAIYYKSLSGICL